MGKYSGPTKAEREKAARAAERDKRVRNEEKMRKAGWKVLRGVDYNGRPGVGAFSARATSYQFALQLFGHESKMADTGKNKRKPECWARSDGYATMDSLQRLFDRITHMGSRSYSFMELAAAAHERDETFRAIDGLRRIGGDVEENMLDPIKHTIREHRIKRQNTPRPPNPNSLRVYDLQLYTVKTGQVRMIVRAATQSHARTIALQETKNTAWTDPDKCTVTHLSVQGGPKVLVK